ncbi:MAG: efflux RND transporter periplasmic adaptor subunit [Myxococcota bacterium]
MTHGRRVLPWLGGAMCLVVGALLVGIPGAGRATDEALIEPGPRRVIVTPVKRSRGLVPLHLHGVVRARQRATLAFPRGGRILARHVEVGDRVQAGELLAEVDPAATRAAVRAAMAMDQELEAQRSLAEQERLRGERLFAAQAISEADLDALRARETSLTAGARARRADTSRFHAQRRDEAIHAPFDGIVSAVHLEAGELATPGMPVLALTGNEGTEVKVEVPEHAIASLQPGQRVEVRLPFLREHFEGQLDRIGERPDQTLYPVFVHLPNGALVGATAEVVLQLRSTPELVVPLAAVQSPAGRQASVFVVEGGAPPRARRVTVEVQRLLDDRVTVRGSLTEDHSVVVEGQSFLLDGDVLEILP